MVQMVGGHSKEDTRENGVPMITYVVNLESGATEARSDNGRNLLLPVSQVVTMV